MARERFADLGYESTTNKDIADAASITTGAIYHYFESKRGLYLAVFEEVEQHVFERFREVAAAGDGFLDKLLRVLDESVAIHRNDPSIAAFFVTVPVDSGRSVDLAGLAARQGRDASDFFRALVDEGLARGEIPDDVHPSDLVNMLMAVTSGMARFSSQVGDADVLEAMTRVVERLLRGQLFTALRR